MIQIRSENKTQGNEWLQGLCQMIFSGCLTSKRPQLVFSRFLLYSNNLWCVWKSDVRCMGLNTWFPDLIQKNMSKGYQYILCFLLMICFDFLQWWLHQKNVSPEAWNDCVSAPSSGRKLPGPGPEALPNNRAHLLEGASSGRGQGQQRPLSEEPPLCCARHLTFFTFPGH